MSVLVDERTPPSSRHRKGKGKSNGYATAQNGLLHSSQKLASSSATDKDKAVGDLLSKPHQASSSALTAEAGPSTQMPSSYAEARSDDRASGRRRVRVAIIGSGLSGLSAAYLLAQASKTSDEVEYEPHIFERAAAVGLDSHSVSHTLAERDEKGKKRSVRVDVPMRSINAGYYPNLMKLYKRLGIPLRRSDFSYSFARQSKSRPRDAPCPSLIYEGASGAKGFALPSILKRRSSSTTRSESFRTTALNNLCNLPGRLSITWSYLSQVFGFIFVYLHLVLLALYHHYAGHTRDPQHRLASKTVGDFFSDLESTWSLRTRNGAGPHRRFLDDLLVPLFGAMMTVQAASVLLAPVAEVLDYVALTLGRSHYVVDTGVAEVEARMIDPMETKNIHLKCTVTGLKVDSKYQGMSKVTVEVIEGANRRSYQDFDHVITATQATQSATTVEALITCLRKGHSTSDGISAELVRLESIHTQLSCFTYEDSEVVTHLDSSLLPANEEDWRDLNLVSPPREEDSLTGAANGSNVALAPEKAASSDKPSLSENTHTMASHIIHRFPPGTSHSSTSTTTTASDEDSNISSLSGSSRPVCHGDVLIQTTNPLRHLRPAKEKIVSESTFERAVLSLSSKIGQAGLFEWKRKHPPSSQWSPSLLCGRDQWEMKLGHLQGRSSNHLPGLWFCGSWSPGIPLLEGCVTSASLVVDALTASEEGRRSRSVE